MREVRAALDQVRCQAEGLEKMLDDGCATEAVVTEVVNDIAVSALKLVEALDG